MLIFRQRMGNHILILYCESSVVMGVRCVRILNRVNIKYVMCVYNNAQTTVPTQ